jgi:hypothetical protein
MERVTPADLEEANARINAELNRLYYGDVTLTDWAGQPVQNGEPVKLPVPLEPASPVEAGEGFPVTERNWGIPQLLWQCPVCRVNDALLHKQPWFRKQTLNCRACDTRWDVERVPTRDFRLKVVAGHPDIIELDMPLSTWYDEMKRGLRLSPIAAPGVDVAEDEEVYLRRNDVELLPYKPSTLLDAWTPGEAPRAQPGGQAQSPGWASLGPGQLVLTNKRLFWQGSQGGLDFYWPALRAISVPWLATLGITYGSALYRFHLGPEAPRKWLTYAGLLAQEAAEEAGHDLTLTPF